MATTHATDLDVIAATRNLAQPFEPEGAPSGYDRLLELIGTARCVLLGEASHGTHEFYAARAAITRRLIAEQGFSAVICEADWPDVYRVNCYVRGASDDASATAALGDFKRFPSWMWRNTVVVEFVEWLRAFNAARTAGQPQAGFYGMDLYSLSSSIEEVVSYLDRVDPAAARRARDRYACFEFANQDPQVYGYATSFGAAESCEDEVVQQLVELQRRAGEVASHDGRVAEDEQFRAEQNARLVRNAEEYYRAMFHGRVSTWNLRDLHMADTLDALLAHLDRHGGRSRVVVWAHNSHLGDARATQMGDSGEHNVGQLVRQRHAGECALIGFSTYTGSVTAASDWGADAERKRVRPALPGSYERLLHAAELPSFMLDLRDAAPRGLDTARLERAIGVIYRPDTERQSHYFYADLPNQFDALLHVDETRALEPLERTQIWERGELPDTYPFAE
jgi:erythromycin esterase-like protein